MKKNYKIKHYRSYASYGNSSTYRPHPIVIIVTILGLIGLALLGILAYQPVYNFVMKVQKEKPAVISTAPEQPPEIALEPEKPIAEPQKTVEESLKMVYLPIVSGESINAISKFNVNTVLFDIKKPDGTLNYNSKNTNAIKWGAVPANAIELSQVVSELNAKGFSLAVRMSAFKDSVAASGNRDLAVKYRDTDARWLDAQEQAGGKAWLNPYSDEARAYITSIAIEAVEAGAKLVILDDFNFASGSNSTNANFGASASTISRQKILQDFISQLSNEIEQKGAKLAIYLPAKTITETDMNLIKFGGNPLDIVAENLVLGLLPYQFGEEFNADGLSITAPYKDINNTLKLALGYVQNKKYDFKIIPLMQGASEPKINAYMINPENVNSQIDAINSQGFSDYVIYQTNGAY